MLSPSSPDISHIRLEKVMLKRFGDFNRFSHIFIVMKCGLWRPSVEISVYLRREYGQTVVSTATSRKLS